MTRLPYWRRWLRDAGTLGGLAVVVGVCALTIKLVLLLLDGFHWWAVGILFLAMVSVIAFADPA